MDFREATKQGFKTAHVGDGIVLDNRDVRARVQSQKCPTLLASKRCVGVLEDDESRERERERVRYLTPREFWRLQDFYFPDGTEAYDKLPDEVSENQRYEQAGNSIAVAPLAAILNELYNKKHIKTTLLDTYNEG